MDVMSEFHEVCKQFPALREAFEAVRQGAHDPAQRALFNEVAEGLDKGFADFKKSVPEMLAEMERLEKEADQLHAENQAKAAAIRQQLAEMPESYPAQAPPAPPEVVFPDDLGQTLRDRLLNRFGDRPLHPPGPDAGAMGSVAREWVATDAPDQSEVSQEPPAPKVDQTAPAPKNVKTGPMPPKDEIWEGLSRMEDD